MDYTLLSVVWKTCTMVTEDKNLAPVAAAAGKSGCTVLKDIHVHRRILLDHQLHMALVPFQVALSYLQFQDPTQ